MAKINPRVDIAFKKIFGVEENKDLLISLINSIISEEDQVQDVKILNPYNIQNFQNDKLSILDIKAKCCDGKRINIEMQITDSADYDKRALYYWAKLYSEQLSAGGKYSNLNKAIGIHILNFTSIIDSQNYHNIFHITDSENGDRYFKEFELHTIELNKFDEDIDDDFSKLLAKMKNKIDIWSAFLTKHELLEERKSELPTSTELQKALNIVNVMNFTEEEQDAYNDHLKWLRDADSALDKKFLEGKEEGREEGREEEKIAIAKSLLEQNIPLDTISSATGLSVNELKKILP